MNPLLTPEIMADRIKFSGVHAAIEQADRGSGRTTACALRLLGTAMVAPGVVVSAMDHAGGRRGHAIQLARAVQHITGTLGLTNLYMQIASSPTGPYVVNLVYDAQCPAQFVDSTTFKFI